LAAQKKDNSGSSKGLGKSLPQEEPTVFRLNTDFKIQMRQPSRQLGETVDENGCYSSSAGLKNNFSSDHKMLGSSSGGSRQHHFIHYDASARSS